MTTLQLNKDQILDDQICVSLFCQIFDLPHHSSRKSFICYPVLAKVNLMAVRNKSQMLGKNWKKCVTDPQEMNVGYGSRPVAWEDG